MSQSDMFSDLMPEEKPEPKIASKVAPKTHQPDDAKKKLFDYGPAVLMAAGMTEAKARTVIGGWLKRTYSSEAILKAIKEAKAESAIDPVSYIQSLLRRPKPVADSFSAVREQVEGKS